MTIMSTGADHDLDVPAGGTVTVAAVAGLVGVAPSTLRTWARRYGLEPSGHRTGLHRRYSETDISRLQLMRSLTLAGFSSRDAAARAIAATPEQLALVGTLPTAADAALYADRGRAGARTTPRAARARGAIESLDPAVRTLLVTAGRGDAQGVTALLRLAIRDLGAARTYDERLRATRAAAWMLPPPARDRAQEVLAGSTRSAVGEVSLRREPRNDLPVHIASLPGHEDPATLALVLAALAERSIRAERLDLGRTEADAGRRLDAAAGSVVALFVAEGLVSGQLAAKLRAATAIRPIFWGEGWLHWPGHEATLADVVRTIEKACTSDA